MQRAEALVRSSYHLTKQKTKKLLSSNSALGFCCYFFLFGWKWFSNLHWSSKAIRPTSSHSTDRPSMPHPKRTVRRPPFWREADGPELLSDRRPLWGTSQGPFLMASPALSVLCGDASCMGLRQGCPWWSDFTSIQNLTCSLVTTAPSEGSLAAFYVACQIASIVSVPWERNLRNFEK